MNATLSNGKNEQFLWSLRKVRDPESPIYGWPLYIVHRACQNPSTGNSQAAEPEYFFPLLVSDINPTLDHYVLPLIVPTMTTNGLMLLGSADIGHAPLAIILANALARYQVATRGLQADGSLLEVGWRHSKQIDGFPERSGELHIPVLLDDPILSSVFFQDIKSLLDVGEACLADAPYRAAKFVRNVVRVLLNIEWGPEQEPDLPFDDHISRQDFHAMFAQSSTTRPHHTTPHHTTPHHTTPHHTTPHHD